MDHMSHLKHWLIPHHTNNQRAKVLHPSSLSLFIGFFLLFQFVIRQSSSIFPSILGYASQIPPEQIITLTNTERISRGLSLLKLDPVLSEAARRKASDMIAKDYWAHVSPSGTQPWFFITESGYSYRYAGENLARDFSDPNSVVKAWLGSPSHRENLLSARYQDIGVAVIDGKLGGRETTLVVQMFGTKLSAAPSVNGGSTTIAVAASGDINPELSQKPLSFDSPNPVLTGPKVSSFEFNKYFSIGLLVFISSILFVDIVIVSRRRLVRWTSKSLAHLVFIIAIIVAAATVLRGQII